jgi:thiamine-phosphate pyrophosphorylase
MSFEPPKLYAITDARLSGLSHSDQVARLVAGGATLIQIREKHLSSRAFCEEAEAALEIARRWGVKLIINDRVDVAMALHADGVHLGQSDLPPQAARKLLGPQAIIGFSVHNTEQAQKAVRLPVDYVAAGPVFATTSKDNPDPVLGLAGIRRIRRIVGTMPLVAIGGINPGNALEVLESGADTVALLSGLVSPPCEIETRTRAVLALISSKQLEK